MSNDVVVAPGRVATVTINRPPDNYFDTALIAGIADAYEALDAGGECRVIVLRSEGKHFCAGAALGGTAPTAVDDSRNLYDAGARLVAAPLPVVAAVKGAAIGGGLGVALSADFRVGSSASRLSANFARLGFHHGFGLSVTLPAVVGQQKAMELLLTGRRINGETAFEIGLLDRLSDDIEGAALEMAEEIAGSAPLAIRSIRQTMRDGLVERFRAATAREKAEQDRLTKTADFAEGVRATAERRTPSFEGR